jgi:hypothetical protein
MGGILDAGWFLVSELGFYRIFERVLQWLIA